MTDINLNKDQLRVRMRTVRKALSDAERLQIDSAICKRVCDTLQFQEAEQVLTYVSMGFEVDTRHLIQYAWDAGKAVFAPRCVGLRTMRWFQIESFTGLQKSSFGVEEPLEDSSVEYIPSSDENALALVPGLAFDLQGYRLGYGGGFYDTFLAQFSGLSFGLCRSIQLVDNLRTQGVIGEYDKPVDYVITEDTFHG